MHINGPLSSSTHRETAGHMRSRLLCCDIPCMWPVVPAVAPAAAPGLVAALGASHTCIRKRAAHPQLAGCGIVPWRGGGRGGSTHSTLRSSELRNAELHWALACTQSQLQREPAGAQAGIPSGSARKWPAQCGAALPRCRGARRNSTCLPVLIAGSRVPAGGFRS